MKLRQIVFASCDIESRRRLFNITTSYIDQAITSYICPIDGGLYKKLNIDLCLNPGLKIETYGSPLGILSVEQEFDFEKYFSDNQNPEMVVDTIEKVMLILCDRFKWDDIKVRNAFALMRAKNFDFKYRFGKPKHNSPRTLIAQLWAHHTRDFYEFSIVVTDKAGNMRKFILITTDPVFYEYTKYYGEIYWRSASIIELVPKQKLVKSIYVDLNYSIL